MKTAEILINTGLVLALAFLPLNAGATERSVSVVYGTASPTGSSGNDSLRYRQFGVVFRNDEGSPLKGLTYRYTPLQLDALDPFTNGHLHQLEAVFGNHDFAEPEKNGTHPNFDWRAQVYAGVSSNMLKNPDFINIHSFDASVDVFRVMAPREETQWLLGISANRHFNRFRVYPNIGFRWKLNDWSAEVKIPQAEIRYQLRADLLLSATVSREGKRWHVYNEDLSRDARIGMVTKGVKTGAAYRLNNAIQLTAEFGYQRYRFTLPELAANTNSKPGGKIREMLLGIQYAL